DYLEVWRVNVLKNPEEINKKEHRTDKFICRNLVVRRGQPFQMKITFNRAYNPETDVVWLDILIGRYPDVRKSTWIQVRLNQELEKGKWGTKVVESIDNNVTLSVTSSSDCIVGKFRMYIAVYTSFGIRRTARDRDTDIYVLFNPWSKGEAPRRERERERETVYLCVQITIIQYCLQVHLNERNTRSWGYGSTSDNIQAIRESLYISFRVRMSKEEGGSEVGVKKINAAKINSRDDDGVIVGNWTDNYSYGLAPTAWTGSGDILLQYLSSGASVCYGQCWVFAAVLNTFLRCLGIPGRVVTNFYSAHDNDGNLVMDVVLDEDGKTNKKLTKDTVWNFHCWNECWMARSDLPAGFGGWQVIDATPQETSEGTYRCGPASVHAVKHGHVFFPYDAPFVFAEVNSDIVYWKRMKDGTRTVVKIDSCHIGKMILTKEVGSDERKDITELYKFPEGSNEERLALESAMKYGAKKEKTTSPFPVDVYMEVYTEKNVTISNDVKLTLEFRNNSQEGRAINVFIVGYIVFYTGVKKDAFMDQTLSVVVEPGYFKNVDVHVKAKDYMSHLVEQASLHFIVTARVNETTQILTAQCVVPLRSFKLNLKIDGKPELGNQMSVTVEFQNPLKKPLENVSVRLEGVGLMRTKIKEYSTIPMNESIKWTEMFVPAKPGLRKMIASLDCVALRQVYGEIQIMIN
uniref:Coagulation factor XIII A chain n=1 Tax=Latimeria chalumnae TaxID=7897 RepID=H3A727_LATCH